MATKKHNIQFFVLNLDNNSEITFKCYTTWTRCGFCHTVVTWNPVKDITDTKVTYYNRTWEKFDYESALNNAIHKCGAKIYKRYNADDLKRTY